MKFDSPFFDRIRVKPGADRRVRADGPTCEWAGCDEHANHRAPKGRLREREYWRFCINHVREYNNSYNYFAGMPDDDVVKHQKADTTGHRPTWFIGVNSWARGRAAKYGGRRTGFAHGFGTQDPFGLFRGNGARPASGAEPPRPIRRAERKCLRQLNLDDTASKAEIKTRFKDLVKRHHPDSNGGDRRSEDKLREVIQAYNYLRQAGLA
jgi:hypothetical protein